MIPRLATLLAISLLAGCASLAAEVNAPLTAADLDSGYRVADLSSTDSEDELLVVVSFSGGGKRSAAFAYGALTAMRDLGFSYGGRQRTLLGEADILSGVSGGSFPAAYYALHRTATFQTFRRDFLDEDFNADIAGIYLLPWRWDWMVNPNWGTNDEMARIYDEVMFKGATFADLQRLGPPYVMIQATDLTTGAAFPFIQSQFDLICSDLTPYPISRAVAASNGFPILFSPITLKNYTANCPAPDPAWVAPALADPDPLSRQRQQALLARRYLKDDAAKYVHLIDGGVGDNLALRGVLDYMSRYDNPAQAPNPDGAIRRVRRVLFISVDGQAEQDGEMSRAPVVGDVLRILNAVTSNTIDQYNFETLRLARSAATNLAENLTAARCGRGDAGAQGARAALVHIALSDQPGAEELKEIPTGLTIESEQIDALIAAGRAAVLRDPSLGAFIGSIEAPDPCPARSASR